MLAAQRILKRRKADLENTVPFSVTGFTQGSSPSASLASIDKRLEALELAIDSGGADTGDGASSGFLMRPDRRWR